MARRPHRCASSWPRATRGSSSSSRRKPRSKEIVDESPNRRVRRAPCFVGVLAVGHTAEPKFFSDDPLAREPETQDASGAQPWDIDLFYDLSYNLFVTPRQVPSGIRAGNVNTIDEVPDSGWFTNRIGSRALTVEEVVRGPVAGPAPVASEVDPHAREERGRRAWLHGRGRRTGRRSSCRSMRGQTPKALPARSSSPRRSSGRSATTRSSIS